MNIYLDIDGVLLANDLNPANHAPEFLRYVLDHYPDSTYWLTTHCNGDAAVPIQHIGHLFDSETAELIDLFPNPTLILNPMIGELELSKIPSAYLWIRLWDFGEFQPARAGLG